MLNYSLLLAVLPRNRPDPSYLFDFNSKTEYYCTCIILIHDCFFKNFLSTTCVHYSYSSCNILINSSENKRKCNCYRQGKVLHLKARFLIFWIDFHFSHIQTTIKLSIFFMWFTIKMVLFPWVIITKMFLRAR